MLPGACPFGFGCPGLGLPGLGAFGSPGFGLPGLGASGGPGSGLPGLPHLLPRHSSCPPRRELTWPITPVTCSPSPKSAIDAAMAIRARISAYSTCACPLAGLTCLLIACKAPAPFPHYTLLLIIDTR